MAALGARKSAEKGGSRKRRLSDQVTLMMYADAFDHSKRKHVSILNINAHIAFLSKLSKLQKRNGGVPRDRQEIILAQHQWHLPRSIVVVTPVLSPQRPKAKPPSSASRWVRQQGAPAKQRH